MTSLNLKEGAGVQTPSQQIIGAANKTVAVTDSRGRLLTLKKISSLDRMRLFRVAGPEIAGNMPWMNYAAIAVSVTAIDGDKIAPAGTIREIEALVDMLGDEGLVAAADCYEKNFAGASSVDEVKDAAKN